MISSVEQYGAVFGHPPPRDVQFTRGDRVLLYAAGEQATTGFEAKLVSAMQSVRNPSVVEVRISCSAGRV